MVISLPEPLDEHVHSLADGRHQTEDLAGPRESPEGSDDPGHAVGDVRDAIGDDAQAFHLVRGLTREATQILGEAVGLAHQGAQLLGDDGEHGLQTPGHSDERDEQDDDRDGDRRPASRRNELPRGHDDGIIGATGPKVNESVDFPDEAFL